MRPSYLRLLRALTLEDADLGLAVEDLATRQEVFPSFVRDDLRRDPRLNAHRLNEQIKLRKDSVECLNLHICEELAAHACILDVPRRVELHAARNIEVDERLLYAGRGGGVVRHSMPHCLNDRLALRQNELIHFIAPVVRARRERSAVLLEDAHFAAGEEALWVPASRDLVAALEHLGGQLCEKEGGQHCSVRGRRSDILMERTRTSPSAMAIPRVSFY